MIEFKTSLSGTEVATLLSKALYKGSIHTDLPWNDQDLDIWDLTGCNDHKMFRRGPNQYCYHDRYGYGNDHPDCVERLETVRRIVQEIPGVEIISLK